MLERRSMVTAFAGVCGFAIERLLPAILKIPERFPNLKP
jgi:hypothetical protein